MRLRRVPAVVISVAGKKQVIREAAKGLGYQPDAMLSALCAYRLTKRMPKGQTVIAWIPNHQTQTGRRMSACTRDYFEGHRYVQQNPLPG